MRVILTISLFLWLIVSNSANAQFVDPREANEHFKKGNFNAAIESYQRLLKKEPNNTDFNYKLGVSYLRSNVNKKKALMPLEKAIKDDKVEKDAWLYYGQALTFHLKFDEAIDAFNKHIENGGDAADAGLAIRKCKSAKQLIQTPLAVSFTNLGKTINSPFPDYYPFVAKDESFIAYTSRRAGNVGGILEFDGFFSSDIYLAEMLPTGTFDKAKNAGSRINSSYDEQAVGLSDDAQTLFVYVDKIKEFGDIYTVEKGRRGFGNLKKMGESINSPELETCGSISADGNTLFFASDRGGEGGLDLWMTRKLPTGDWALPQNLGAEINTPYNEDFPTLSADGKTLYFSSSGHDGMGGYDLYTSQWDVDANQWSKPENIGYPINTPGDERTISFSEDGRSAYISALRDDGLGDLDIYKITFEDQPAVQMVYQLKLATGDTTSPYATDAFVTIENEFGDIVGDYSPNQRTGSFTIILSAGTYTMLIDAPGFPPKTESLTITPSEAKMGFMTSEISLASQ